MLNCAHELQERRNALRAEVEANRQFALTIQERVPNARAVDGYSWLVFRDNGELFLETIDDHSWYLRLTPEGTIDNEVRGFAEDRLAQLNAVVAAFHAETPA